MTAAAPICCSALVQLLSPSNLKLEILGTPRQPMAPHESVYHVQRGRLLGQVDASLLRTMTGARGRKHLLRQRQGPQMPGAYLTISVPKALTTAGRGPLKGPFEDIADSHVGHATLVLNALAVLGHVPPSLPLFLIVRQNYHLGFAPLQVVAIDRNPELATRFFDFLKNAYRFDPRSCADLGGPDTRTLLPKAPRAADCTNRAGAGAGAGQAATLFG